MRLAAKVEDIKGTLDNDEQKVLLLFSSLRKIPCTVVPRLFAYVNVNFLKAGMALIQFSILQIGADIVKRALRYPMKLIAKNAGVNGSVVIEKV